ncbi:MAG: Jag N-terminal domain-containing protein [bacterium]
MREIQVEAKNVQLAVDKALKDIGLRRDQVEVVVLSEGKSGFLGIGAKKACVVVREKKWTGNRKQGREPLPPRKPEFRHRQPSSQGAGDRPPTDSEARRTQSGQHRQHPPQSSGYGGRSESGQHRQHGRKRGYGHESRRETRIADSANQQTAPASGTPPQHSTSNGSFQESQVRIHDTAGKNDAGPGSAGVLCPEPGRPRNGHEETTIRRKQEKISTVEAQQAVELSKSVLSEILSLLGMGFTISRADWDPVQSRVHVEFDSDAGDSLVGKDGYTLEALQLLTTLIVSRKGKLSVAVQVDTLNYWKTSESELMARVSQAVENVRKTGQPVRLAPMSSPVRRFIHKTLASTCGDVETASEGEGRFRKIVIKPAQKK